MPSSHNSPTTSHRYFLFLLDPSLTENDSFDNLWYEPSSTYHSDFSLPDQLVTFYLKISSAERFPETFSPYYLCSGVVDYDFALPLGETFDSLNAQAIAMMNPSWGFLSAECKSDMKRLTCATVYLPSSSTGNKRPCKSLCDATTYLGTTCGGMMESFGTAVNCSLPIFDPSNDPSLCNAMESTEVNLFPDMVLTFPSSSEYRTRSLLPNSLRNMLVKCAKVSLRKLQSLPLTASILSSHLTSLPMQPRYRVPPHPLPHSCSVTRLSLKSLQQPGLDSFLS